MSRMDTTRLETGESTSIGLSSDAFIIESRYFGNQLKSLRGKNINCITIAQIDTNSIRNKFGGLVHGVMGNIDIFLIFETKLDNSLPTMQFLIDGYTLPHRLDRNGKRGWGLSV